MDKSPTDDIKEQEREETQDELKDEAIDGEGKGDIEGQSETITSQESRLERRTSSMTVTSDMSETPLSMATTSEHNAFCLQYNVSLILYILETCFWDIMQTVQTLLRHCEKWLLIRLSLFA